MGFLSTEQDLDAAQRQAVQRQMELGARLGALPEVQPQDSRFDGEITLVAESLVQDAVSAVVEELVGPAAKPANAEVPAELRQHPLLDAIGGIRPSQTLYLKDLGEGLSLYVAYWPWGGGGRFTIKIGVYLRRLPPAPPE
jgi:hypothetical protein